MTDQQDESPRPRRSGPAPASSSGKDGGRGEADFERIAPADFGHDKPSYVPPGADPPPSGGGRGDGGGGGLLRFAGLVAVLLLVVAVFVLLPRWVERPVAPPNAEGSSATPAAAGDAAQEGGPEPTPADGAAQEAAAGDASGPAGEASQEGTSEEDIEAMLAARAAAQEARQRYAEAREALGSRSPGVWAAQDLAELEAQATEAEQAFSTRGYARAQTLWRAAREAVEALEARAQSELKQALSAGSTALAEGRKQAAVDAFQRALTIAPDNEAARQGLSRAENLDALRARLNEAADAEARGDLAAAREAYRAAVDLDGQSQRAREGLARVESALAQRAFSEAMSRGLSALDRGDFATAESAFQAALRQRPGAPEARDGLRRARLGLQQERIDRLRRRAETLVAAERWAEARDVYDQALALDSTLDFARQGRERAEARAELDARLQGHLEKPERLSAPSVREDAARWLEAARAVDNPGRRLSAQIAALQAQLRRASTPVPVTLRSDGRTQVVVYQVGELGRFERKTVELTPGNYTVVGRCPGYRDVMHRFTVSADGVSALPLIRCEEKI